MNELIIDSFAGGGGASTGIEQALGRYVDIAINHDESAILMHKTNHPHTKHYCENIWEVDPKEATKGQKVGLMWASPDCKHFSKAKGGKPVDKNIRGLAWVVVKWAKAVKPRVIILENVEEFKTWGPLIDNRPDPDRKGETFGQFVKALKRFGYKVGWRELRACDYGAPTIRKRFFLIARCDGKPIRWPEPSHGDPETLEVHAGLLEPWRTAAECIDWSIPCPSIFTRKKPLAEKTLARIAGGIQKFVIDNPKPYILDNQAHFITQYHSYGNEVRGQEVDSPLLTQDTSNRYGLVKAFLISYYGNGDDIGQRLDEPLRTITAKDRFGVVTVQGQDYHIVDIGMRMLQPHELFKAQGFPDDYIIDRDYTGKAYPKTHQVARCGNSVCPPIARALVEVNLPEMITRKEEHTG